MSDEEPEAPTSAPEAPPPPTRGRAASRGRAYAIGVVVLTLVAAAAGQMLYHHATSQPLVDPLADLPAEVTCVSAEAASYRPTARYVGTIEPWLEASIGPQLTSAYVTDVRVRPGAVVARGDILATLDCRESRATASVSREEALAVAAQEQALTRQAERTRALLDAGFVALNQVDQQTASSEERRAQRVAREAEASRSSLFVSDCTLRAPFDGEVDVRSADPGAFVGPGSVVVGVVDRSMVRIVADIPETALDEVAPGRPLDVHILATDATVHATVTRRAPAADPVSRTIRIEIDLPNDDHSMPVRTTAEILVTASEGISSISLPLTAAIVVGARARVWVIEDEVAHPRTLRVIGEEGDHVFVQPQIAAGTTVVVEGREALDDGTRVHVGRAATSTASAERTTPDTGAAPP
jgi:RND family efflux transporter MFP subunit